MLPSMNDALRCAEHTFDFEGQKHLFPDRFDVSRLWNERKRRPLQRKSNGCNSKCFRRVEWEGIPAPPSWRDAPTCSNRCECWYEAPLPELCLPFVSELEADALSVPLTSADHQSGRPPFGRNKLLGTATDPSRKILRIGQDA